MKRLLTFISLLMILASSILIPTQSASAQNGPDICAAAANGEAIPGYEVVYGRGGPGHQVVLGDDGDNDLRGGSGHDMLCGFGGNDILRGNSGNDILVGGDGDDTLRGGSGNDEEIQDGGPSGGGGIDTSACNDGNWQNLAPAGDDTNAFDSIDACITYIINVGPPVPVEIVVQNPVVTLQATGGTTDGKCDVRVAVTGFDQTTTLGGNVQTVNGNVRLGISLDTDDMGAGSAEPGSVAPGMYRAAITVGPGAAEFSNDVSIDCVLPTVTLTSVGPGAGGTCVVRVSVANFPEGGSFSGKVQTIFGDDRFDFSINTNSEGIGSVEPGSVDQRSYRAVVTAGGIDYSSEDVDITCDIPPVRSIYLTFSATSNPEFCRPTLHLRSYNSNTEYEAQYEGRVAGDDTTEGTFPPVTLTTDGNGNADKNIPSFRVDREIRLSIGTGSTGWTTVSCG